MAGLKKVNEKGGGQILMKSIGDDCHAPVQAIRQSGREGRPIAAGHRAFRDSILQRRRMSICLRHSQVIMLMTRPKESHQSSRRSNRVPRSHLTRKYPLFGTAESPSDWSRSPKSRTSSKLGEDVVASEAPVAPDAEDAEEQRTIGPDDTGTYPNGYRFPPKHTWQKSTAIGLRAFWKFACTPFGFIITIYGLNVVAWGAMIFFLLLNAAPAMCHPSCNADYSGRKIWIEVDAQVLNALFCVTGFGLAPWRFRDFYYLMRWRVGKDYDAHRRLAGIYRGWFRLAGSEKLPENMDPPLVYTKKNPRTEDSPPPYTEGEIKDLEANPAIPLPATSMPPAPLTGIRSPPTKLWVLDFVIWMYLINTLLQCILSGAMWGWNRFHRPSWLVGLAISLGCVVAMAAGLAAFFVGKKVKAIEGIPVEEEEVIEDVEKRAARKRDNAKLVNGSSGNNEEGDGGELEVVETRIEKKKGKGWFERH